MVQNLAKSPLIAVFFGALLYFAGVYIPYSEAYRAVAAEFVMPLLGNLLFIAFALWISIICAVAFGSAEKGGIRLAGMTALAVLGTSWVIPLLQPVIYGESAGVPGASDALFPAAFYAVCTILGIVLCTLLYRTQATPADPRPSTPKHEVTYKLKPLGLAIKFVVLPIAYCVLFFVAWYFLHWRNEEVRAFYGGIAENPGFVGSVVNVLLYDVWMLPLGLLKGFAYTLFALPLLFVFPGKRAVYILLTAMLSVSGSVWLLIPTPLMPDPVRYSNCVYTAALHLVFGVLAALLLHTSFKKEVHETPQPQRRPLTPQQQALAAARAKAAQGPTAKQAAEAISSTMKGEDK